MQYQNILFSIEAGIATLTLNRPDKLNSFTQAMHEEVRDALARVKQDSSVRVFVLAAAGRGFCAGQDLSDRAVAPGAPAVDLGESVEKNYAPLVLALRALPMLLAGTVQAMALHFSSAPTKGLAFTKQALYASPQNTLAEQLALEAGMMSELGRSSDYREGVA
eukprot:gene16144-15955_t